MKQLSGTYRGLGSDVELILRLDIDGPSPLNMLSGELNQSVRLREFNYFNLREHSFIGDDITRTEEGNRLILTTPIRFFRLPELTGTIDVEIQPTSAVARLKLTGYGYHKQPLTFALEKTSDYFRTVRLEIDLEQGTPFPGPFKPWDVVPENRPAGMPEEPITIQGAFHRAGIDIIVHPVHSVVPPPGVDLRWSIAELHAAMMNFFALISNDPTWNVWLLVGERFVSPGVSGIMFDQTNPLPRQGAAVFYSRFRNLPDGVRERNFVRTAVHELGHALNLLHSFQKGVFSEFGFGDNPFMTPRSDALSFMNYDWRYPYGHNMPFGWDGTEDYWARFRFEFDELELMHIRHHDRLEVIFGGEAFGIHGHSRVPALEPQEITQTNQRSPLKLELRGKRVKDHDVRAFELMEPIHLELKLECKGHAEVEVINQLDPMEGVVAIYIQKPTGEVVKFRPLMTACADSPQREILKPGLPLYKDLHVTFGKDGFYFQEPGIYAIRAVYLGGERLTTYSNVVAIRVGAPKTTEQELLASDFFDPMKGQLLAVGPSASYQFTSEINFFRELAERLPQTAVGRALAAYLGMVDGVAFKDVVHERVAQDGMAITRASFSPIKVDAKKGLTYLDEALKAAKTPFESLSNLRRWKIALDRVRVLQGTGDITKAKAAMDDVKTLVTGAITKNEKLRQRELNRLEKIKEQIGARKPAAAAAQLQE